MEKHMAAYVLRIGMERTWKLPLQFRVKRASGLWW